MVIGTQSNRIKVVNYVCHACGAIRPTIAGPLYLCPECGGGMQRTVQIVKVSKPKKHPRCPFCQGSGIIEAGFSESPVGGTIPVMKQCEKCKGKGHF